MVKSGCPRSVATCAATCDADGRYVLIDTRFKVLKVLNVLKVLSFLSLMRKALKVLEVLKV